MAVNKQIIIGNVGRDPELRYTQSGTAVANLTVAATTGWGDREHTEWFDIVAWGKTAESVAEYLEKGSKVYIEGETRTRQWEDRDGNTRYNQEVHAREVKFL